MNPYWKLLLVLFAPLFMFNVCGKHDQVDEILPPDHPNTDEYFTFRFPGHNINVTTPDSVVYGYYNGTRNVIVSYTGSNSHNTYMSYNAAQNAGGYPGEYLNIYTGGKYYVSTGQTFHVIVDNIGAIGQDITGSYSGTLKDSVGTNTYTVTGTFKVKRQ